MSDRTDEDFPGDEERPLEFADETDAPEGGGLEDFPVIPLMDVDDGEVAEQAELDGSEPGLIRDYFETILVAILIVLFLQTFIFQQSKIPSSSMEDTLLIGDHILVNKFVFSPALNSIPFLPHRDPRRGDIVIFHPPVEPEKDYIKRVIGLPGDVLSMNESQLLRNHEKVLEPYVKLAYARGQGRSFPSITVPEGHYFLMGDNRDESQDSRVWGPIPRDTIHGRAVFIWFSLRQSPTVTGPDPKSKIKEALRSILSLPSKGRWDRTLKPIR